MHDIMINVEILLFFLYGNPRKIKYQEINGRILDVRFTKESFVVTISVFV